MKTIRLTSGLRVAGMLFVLMAGAMLQGCGGGGSSTPPTTPTADPTGYYDVTGTASVGDGSGGTLTITDMEAMVYNKRILMMSHANNLLYDISVSTISGNDFSGSATIYYISGTSQLTQTTTVTGTITSGKSISGKFNGAGYGSGNFDLNYNNQMGALPTSTIGYSANIGGSSYVATLNIDPMGGVTNSINDLGDGYTAGCYVDAGALTALGTTGIFDAKITLSLCGNAAMNGDYEGLVVFQDAASTIITFAIVKLDGSYSLSNNFAFQ